MNTHIKESTLNRNQVANLLILVAVVITIVGFASDFYNTISYPGSDLRNRVVGARLMLEGIDPYLFKWQVGLSERFFDPLDDPTELVSKLSVPPTVLTLHAAIANLPYIQQKVIWLLCQWAALVGTIGIFLRNNQSKQKQMLMLSISFCIVNSLFWRFHVSSGQIYILYVFVLAISWFFLQRRFKYKAIISGFLAGVATSLRPSFILFFIPFAVRRQFTFLLSGCVGFISSVLISYWVVGGFIWKRYILTILQMTGLLDLATYLSPAESALPDPNIVYPSVVEGFDWSISYPLERYFADTSFYLPLNVLRVPNEREILIVGLLTTIVYLSVQISKFLPREKEMNYIFLFGVLMCLLGDFFIPIPRYPYYDVQMILPLLIIICLADVHYLVSRRLGIALAVGLLLGLIGFLVIPRALFFGGFLIALYVSVMPILLVKRERRMKV